MKENKFYKYPFVFYFFMMFPVISIIMLLWSLGDMAFNQTEHEAYNQIMSQELPERKRRSGRGIVILEKFLMGNFGKTGYIAVLGGISILATFFCYMEIKKFQEYQKGLKEKKKLSST